MNLSTQNPKLNLNNRNPKLNLSPQFPNYWDHIAKNTILLPVVIISYRPPILETLYLDFPTWSEFPVMKKTRIFTKTFIIYTWKIIRGL